jgi:hypothetical protein
VPREIARNLSQRKNRRGITAFAAPRLMRVKGIDAAQQ